MEMKIWLFHRGGGGAENNRRGVGTEADARAYVRHLNRNRTQGLWVVRKTSASRTIDLAAELAKIKQSEALHDAADATRAAA